MRQSLLAPPTTETRSRAPVVHCWRRVSIGTPSSTSASAAFVVGRSPTGRCVRLGSRSTRRSGPLTSASFMPVIRSSHAASASQERWLSRIERRKSRRDFVAWPSWTHRLCPTSYEDYWGLVSMLPWSAIAEALHRAHRRVGFTGSQNWSFVRQSCSVPAVQPLSNWWLPARSSPSGATTRHGRRCAKRSRIQPTMCTTC